MNAGARHETEERQAIPQCTSAQEAKERLEAVLESMGASIDPEYEPGLDPHQHAKEDNLRAAIAYLRTLDSQGGHAQPVVIYATVGVVLLLGAGAWAACEFCIF